MEGNITTNRATTTFRELDIETRTQQLHIVTTEETGEDSGGSLLWLPYFFLTLFLIGLCITSFWKYHHSNKDKNKEKSVFVEDKVKSTQTDKFKVTMKNNGSMPSAIDLLDIVCEDRTRPIQTDTSNLTNYASVRNLSQNRQPGFEMLGHEGSFKDERMFASFHGADLQQLHDNTNLYKLPYNMENMKTPGFDIKKVQTYDNLAFTDSTSSEISLRIPPVPPKRNVYNINRFIPRPMPLLFWNDIYHRRNKRAPIYYKVDIQSGINPPIIGAVNHQNNTLLRLSAKNLLCHQAVLGDKADRYLNGRNIDSYHSSSPQSRSLRHPHHHNIVYNMEDDELLYLSTNALLESEL